MNEWKREKGGYGAKGIILLLLLLYSPLPSQSVMIISPYFHPFLGGGRGFVDLLYFPYLIPLPFNPCTMLPE